MVKLSYSSRSKFKCLVGKIYILYALVWVLLVSLAFKTPNYKAFLNGHYQFIGVLIGSFIILLSMGTFTNWDAQLEFEAASNVVTHGFPIVTTGLMINQPPFGFYVDSPVFHIFGLSYLNGVEVATAFGLGCIVLIYSLGCMLYGKRTGLVAAALFGIVPWQVFMSRTFLIDNQYLFLSLLFMLLGIFAVRKNSEKFLLASGMIFALAILTKLFAVLMVIPFLIMIYASGNDSGFKLKLRKTLLFLTPMIVFQSVWYGFFANQNFLGVYFSTDFLNPVHITNPSLLFLPSLFVESTGWFLLLAGLFSFTLTFLYRRALERIFRVDLICFASIAAVAGLDMLFVFGFHLTVPYVSAFKYNYSALPFLCLLAASLTNKSKLLIDFAKLKNEFRKLSLIPIAIGLFLLPSSMLENIYFLNKSVATVFFKVDSKNNYFPFYAFTQPPPYFQVLHYAATVLIGFSLTFDILAGYFKRRSDFNKGNN